MSDLTGRDVDAELDRALQALAGETTPAVDLHGRVMAAIHAHASERGGAGRFGWRTRGIYSGLLARPVFAMATVAMLVLMVLGVWLNTPREASRPLRNAGRETPGAGPRTNGARTTTDVPTAEGSAASVVAGPATGSRALVTRDARRARRPMPETAQVRLPPLEAPEPIELESIAAPPVQVAALHVERLSIDALEVEPLDHSGKE